MEKEEDVLGLIVDNDVSKLKPLGDRILVKVSEAEEQTAAGLLLTSAATEKPTFGEVTCQITLLHFLVRATGGCSRPREEEG